ncbi:uncharacterized protein LOC114311240 isoform X2 [Camellia sinensis]|uniref:RRM domain-containing protein n=1 Tax=Camellia sinensis var. sinensis TaxID=542762 RepID=A0A4S4DE76_CAMSN|nr:uncharacterized protein LOC114311240 isoform X2 [Camellia sinensis]THG00981.1 hypothetical protein TEA_001384 [Camellia sinensis var. sinensis]
MGIFSESPKSFKMDRKSPLAAALKSSISDKLLQFLGNYTDDVLAEYIIVLVCNGKHQVQARDDLEAFLGERSGEFVSWLWDHLLKFAHQSSSAIGSLDPKDVTSTSPSNDGADKDLRSNRLRDDQNHGNGNADSSLTKNGKYCHTSLHPSSPDPSNNVEHSEGIQDCNGLVAPLNLVNTKKVQSQKQRNAVPREVGPMENIHDDSLTHMPSRIGGSSLISTRREQSSECVDKSKKTFNHKGNGLPSQPLDVSRRGMVFRNLQPSIIEDTDTKQIYDANVSARSPPKADGEISCRMKKSRGSVWDRLGKPCKENCFVNDKAVDAHAVDIVEKDQEMYDQHTLLVPVRNEELCESIKNEVNELDNSGSGNNPGECRKMEQGESMICKLHAANDIRRKRHFGEISSGPNSCLVSLVGGSNMDHHQYKESSQDFKRSNSTSEAAAPALVSQVQDVKQRLHQIEMEMSKLRTKQQVMKQPHELTNSGVLKHSEEDVESRTVFVTNVHFAATKEALSLHFAKCGVVLSVAILTDTLNGQPKGSAYITFANKESVDKAVALSGTSLFSRTLKVLRKAEEATMTTTPQRAGKPAQAQFSRINRKTPFDRPFHPNSRLQWRREPTSAPSEPSASITQKKGVSSAASRASVSTTKTATSSTGTPAAA